MIVLKFFLTAVAFIAAVAFLAAQWFFILGFLASLFGKEKKEKSWIDNIPDQIIFSFEKENPQAQSEPMPCRERLWVPSPPPPTETAIPAEDPTPSRSAAALSSPKTAARPQAAPDAHGSGAPGDSGLPTQVPPKS